jgi:hypothetical protein
LSYLIDGHNLIPKIQGLSLSNIDDEMELVGLLQIFCRINRRKVEVFFDGAAPGFCGKRRHGMVVANYIRRGIPADLAMIDQMRKIGRAAPNWTVVSSDHLILSEARALHFRLIKSEDFAVKIIESLSENNSKPNSEMDKDSSADNINEWLNLFGGE